MLEISKPLVKPGSEILTYTDRTWRGFWQQKIDRRFKVLGEPSNKDQVPVCERTPTSYESNYKTISERGLYRAMMDGKADVARYEKLLSIQELNFGDLWKWYCEGVFEKVRNEAKENSALDSKPSIWVGLDSMGRINGMGYSKSGHGNTNLYIEEDNQIIPTGAHPNLIGAIEIFNWIMLYEEQAKRNNK